MEKETLLENEKMMVTSIFSFSHNISLSGWLKVGIVWQRVNPLPDDTILDWSKLKQLADDNFRFDESSRKFSEQVEITVGKGEIARYEQFLLFAQCFKRSVSQGRQKVS